MTSQPVHLVQGLEEVIDKVKNGANFVTSQHIFIL